MLSSANCRLSWQASKKRPSLHYTIFPIKEEADGKKPARRSCWELKKVLLSAIVDFRYGRTLSEVRTPILLVAFAPINDF